MAKSVKTEHMYIFFEIASNNIGINGCKFMSGFKLNNLKNVYLCKEVSIKHTTILEIKDANS